MMSIGLDQAEVYYNNPDYHVRGLTRRCLAWAFPHWIFRHRGRDILRCPPGRVLAMELLRIAPPKPWLFNSSWAETFNMESDAMLEYYAAAGIPREQMVVTGSTADDVMAAAQTEMAWRREKLCHSLGLAPGLPVILTALPPDFLDQPGGRPECDFHQYDALVDFWLKTCCSIRGYNVIVALHPSVPPADAAKFERYGARVAPLNTAEMIPLCDIFVASISSTIRWAIACGKPVINYDVYRYRYTDFIGIEGVLTFEEQHEFIAALRRITSDPPYLTEIQRKQAAAAPLWGRLDGKSGERLVELVRRLLPSSLSSEARSVS
jgi:CDP-glycerol glycerophosphotransferase (TagB/SpsB family)